MNAPTPSAPLTPEERKRRRRRRWAVVLGVVAVLGLLGFVWFRRNVNVPVTYADIEDHFKYGSIGSDNTVRGMPLAVLKILPRAFPQYMPPGAPRDLTAFGFLQEPGAATPIGFSRRKQVVEIAGLNCAVCHTGTVRETPASRPVTYLGMPSHQLDLDALFDFLFAAAVDHRFTAENLMPLVTAESDLGFLERLITRAFVIPAFRTGLLEQRDLLGYQYVPGHTRGGPGRVDTFGAYKVSIYRFPAAELPAKELTGVADLPSIWNQAPREGLPLHWDGNNHSLMERNFSAAFGAGATPATVDIPSLERIQDWLREFPPPPYPFPVDRARAAAGERVYMRDCYACHGRNEFGPGGRDRRDTRIGQVEPLARIGTDPYRNWSFTRDLALNQGTLMAGTRWRLKSFRVTDGYVNAPLDGIWLRAPYLHNGSVPTLYDLLKPAAERPRAFYRGYDVYDQANVGFVHNVSAEGNRRYSLFRTHDDAGQPIAGNDNAGHEYGTTLSEAEKRQLIEFLKTL
ncbi:MAG TPA: hypothetical protein VFX98_07620 [Longimicrobiaceae bacterium]|nr:hypothetical protein [Longimicrobiaceae bacterium]